MNEREIHWKQYFESRFLSEESDIIKKLDFSNEPLRQQVYACLLEGVGPKVGVDILDAGCGNGDLALACQALGANVVGIDINKVVIDRLSVEHPQVHWKECIIGDQGIAEEFVEKFGRIICSEVLQYVDIEPALRWLWGLLAPKGRMVLMVPNKDCEIVKRTETRFSGRYSSLSIADWRNSISKLEGVSSLWMRTLAFRADQRLQPYEAGAWHLVGQSVVPEFPAPNRVQWIIEKRG